MAFRCFGVGCDVSAFLKPFEEQMQFSSCPKKGKDKLELQVRNLSRIHTDIDDKLSYQLGMEPGTKCKDAVKRWLVEVQETIENVVLTLSTSAEITSGTCCCCPRSNYKFGKKIMLLLEQIHTLVQEKENFDDKLVHLRPYDPISNIPNLRDDMIGKERKMQLSELLGYLKLEDSQVTTIGIVGMGGVGKTTMLKSIKKQLSRGYFDHIVWIEIKSRDTVDIFDIQRQIAGFITLSFASDNEPERARTLLNILRVKKSLILIDNVWKELELEKIGIPYLDTKNIKIIFTTRSEQICTDMKAQKLVRLRMLENAESLDLFQQNVSPLKVNSVRPYVDEIIGICGGLPLVIVVVAKSVENYETVREWEDAIENLKRSPIEIDGMVNKVMTCLKFSYDELKDENIKSCLSYCSTYTEGSIIEQDYMIRRWRAEGFLDVTGRDNGFWKCYNRGVGIIRKLKSVCLIETDREEGLVRVHDVVGDMLCWINEHENQEVMLVYDRDDKSISNYDRWDMAKRICLRERHVKTFPKKEEGMSMPKCSNLMSLLVQRDILPEHAITTFPSTVGFFDQTPNLRVLCLRCPNLVKIPKSIANLTSLRHLDLSGTALETLPEELGQLRELRYLILSNTWNLKTIYRSTIISLTMLESLDLSWSRYQWETETSTRPTVNLQDLKKLRHLDDLSLNVGSTHEMDVILGDQDLSTSITSLVVDSIDFNKLSVGSVMKFPKIKELILQSCTLCGNVLDINPLHSLEHLDLLDLKMSSVVLTRNNNIVWSLTQLRIYQCSSLEELSWTAHLPHLRFLEVNSCKKVAQLVLADTEIIQEDGEACYFQNLRKLKLMWLENLEKLCGERHRLSFPMLKYLIIIDCPKLRQLSFNIDSARNIEFIKCDQDQRNLLEWDNDHVKDKFLSYFGEKSSKEKDQALC